MGDDSLIWLYKPKPIEEMHKLYGELGLEIELSKNYTSKTESEFLR
jgi:hypothetical protein